MMCAPADLLRLRLEFVHHRRLAMCESIAPVGRVLWTPLSTGIT